MNKLKIAFISLGCSKNLVDSQRVLGMLLPECELTADYQVAEVIFINTCGFIEAAKKEAIDTILEMAECKKSGKCQKLVVLGCLAERYQAELEKEMPEIDLIVPLAEYVNLRKILSDFLEAPLSTDYGKKRQLTTSPYSAYLKIADGCDNHCSYCAIPLIRKNYRSTGKKELVSEAQELLSRGVKELVLIAQDSTLYGKDLYGRYALTELLTELNDLPGEFWIRILYMYPELLSYELIDTMNRLPKVLMYFDVPMQYGNDRMLKLMNRRGSITDFMAKTTYLKQLKVPYVLRTTLMVGFPDEKDKDFQDLCDFVTKVRFHRLGAFIYSKEEDTPAYDFKPEVDPKTAQKRFMKILSLQQGVAKARNEELLNQEISVLIEEEKNGYYVGRSLYQSPEGVDGFVYVSSKLDLAFGEFYSVKITSVSTYDLFGVVDVL